MNRVLQFFDYDGCYRFYTRRIMNIRQAKIHGETIVAKPVLLLTIIDGIEEGRFQSNRFVLDEWMEQHYTRLMQYYARESRFDATTGIDKPFWHLESDGFWHLNCRGTRPSKSRTPSKAWLKEYVEFAHLDDPLWIMLQNRVWRVKLRDYIIEHKLTDDFWNGKMAAEGLSILAAILLAA